MFPRWGDWNIEYTKKGVWNMRRRRATRTLAVLLAVVGAYRFRQSGLDVKGVLRNIVQGAAASVVEGLGQVRRQISV